MLSPIRFCLGFLLAAAISSLALRAGALTMGGAVAATVVGTLTFGAGGLPASVLMVLFFFSSSLLTRVGARRKEAVTPGHTKSGRRDAMQVLANGAAAAGLTLGVGLDGHPIWFAGVVGALAAVTADTWATEVGFFSPVRPRRITDGSPVAAGTSGAVSPVGLAGAAAGACLIGATGAGLGAGALGGFYAAVAGFGGALLDSVLGATVQAMYFCPACAQETEQSLRHWCGSATRPLRGWRWLDNDAVNFGASILGAGGAMAAGAALGLA